MKGSWHFWLFAIIGWASGIPNFLLWVNQINSGMSFRWYDILFSGFMAFISLLFIAIPTIILVQVIRDQRVARRIERIEKEAKENESNFQEAMQALGFSEDPVGKILEMTSEGKLIWTRKPINSKVGYIFVAQLADDLRVESGKMDMELPLLGGRRRVICWSLDFIDAKKRFWATGISYWDHCRGEDGISGDKRAKELFDCLLEKSSKPA